MRLWKQSPNESPGKIHGIALRQLTAKQEIAKSWHTFYDTFQVLDTCTNEQYLRCYKCDLAIYQTWYTDKEGVRRIYRYADDEKLALTVAHISNHHPEVYSAIE